MSINWRKWNNIIHRDIGYFFFGVTIIYAISGIALNHKVMNHWNPDYIISAKGFYTKMLFEKDSTTEDDVKTLLKELGESGTYKKHYFPSDYEMKIFIDGGSIILDITTGKGLIETARKRPVFNQFNFLHYNPNIWWTWFSDIYAVALFTLAITGLFIIKGKNGIKGRGAWLAIAGILIPIMFLFVF